MSKRKVGQITTKKIGNKFAACISGTPEGLYNSLELAEKMVEKLREKYGRRNYNYNKKNKIKYKKRKTSKSNKKR